jgi:pimeloyl-ACP methyl ester carboxylesterase
MPAPETRYAKSGEVSIAYQVVGKGEHDIVFVPGYISNVELVWEWEPWARLYELLAGLGRLIIFDKRGAGLSDRATGIAQLETRMDDVRAVMDAAGSERGALVGVSEGVPMTLLFAATSAQDCTRARWSSPKTSLVGSPSTSARVCRRVRSRGRCSCPTPSRVPWPARASGSKSAYRELKGVPGEWRLYAVRS